RLLVMGPDCGTAIINGVGLGFANRVRRGGVGIVAASGTGLQAVAAGAPTRGAGISQATGTGGRALTREVGGTTALQGLKLLADDPHTEVIVIVSKPPAADVAERLLGAAQAAGKPVVVHFIGYPPPARSLNNLHFALSLEDAAVLATELTSAPPNTLSGSRVAPPPTTATADHVGPRYLRGLFSGGTLAYEALLGLQPFLAPLYSNVPIRPEQRLEDSLSSQAHTVLDLGEDEFTQGRLHPMMDNDLRLRRLREEADDPEVSVILIDVVLGEGAHPDPASELALAIARVREARDDLTVAAVVVGTDEDPQGLDEQIAQLAEAGVEIFSTTTEAVAAIVPRLTKARPETEQAELQFGESLSAINVGVESFYDSLRAQGAEAVQVEWRPPAGGNEKLMAILARMKSK
ncbi:MAG: hypothetical protein R3272_02025, partial [Candidatus Promineifilaceae bacterium]|nr:hypothetical protein [Candidatus Promineifilaceae bacterium]